EAEFDNAGHLKTSSSLTLRVYTADDNQTGQPVSVTLYGGKTDYTYAEDDYLLVNAVMDGTNIKQVNKNDDTAPYGKTAYHLDILGEAESFVGTQTTVWVKGNPHVIDGTTYDDANPYFLDAAQSTKADFVWFLDQ